MEPAPHSDLLPDLAYSQLLLDVSSPEALLGLMAIVLLLGCSALISGSEVAYFSLTHEDFKQLKAAESVNGARILKLINQPRRLLATILISNNFINIAIVILSDFVLQNSLPPGTFEQWSSAILSLFTQPDAAQVAGLGRFISFLITVAGVTFLLVLFGEVAPKVYAKLNNKRLALLMASPLSALLTIFRPLSMLLVRSTRLIEQRLAHRSLSANTSREEIDEAIELTVRQEQGARRDIDILKSIVKFGEVTVKQIMRSRVDVVAVDFRVGYHELLALVKEAGYSRIPVYENDFDNVTGVLYVKDLLGHLNEADDFEWQELIRTGVYYVPEAKKIHDLLKEFQQERLHLAIVVDEYGGSSGIVTLEDIMEEVIGEIKDEFDDEVEVVYRKIDDYNYLFEGKTLLNDVCRIVGIDTNTFDEVKGEADSLAGLILEIHGLLPKADSKITYESYQFKIVSVNKRRIEQILFTLPKN